MSTLIHHPILAVKREARHLRDVEESGESAEALAIALGGMAIFLWTVALIMIGLAFGAALALCMTEVTDARNGGAPSARARCPADAPE